MVPPSRILRLGNGRRLHAARARGPLWKRCQPSTTVLSAVGSADARQMDWGISRLGLPLYPEMPRPRIRVFGDL